MSLAVDPTLRDLDDCGCCEGRAAQTPVRVRNRPGLKAIAYRVGTHSQFKQTMLAALSEASRPALQDLKTRDDDDLSIALLDGWATVADVLTFYQERIANESYLRTATERLSVLELARAIGYQLSPGVAASTYLAFTLEDTESSPTQITVAKGTKVQSIPGPDETAQTFETAEKIEARVAWNSMQPQQTVLRSPLFGDRQIYLDGITTNLKPGDPLLIVGAERAADPTSERWEIRRVASVTPDTEADHTLVKWDEPLGSALPHVEPPGKKPRVYALRLRAPLFGHNAQEWSALPASLRIGEDHPNTGAFQPGIYASRQNSWADAKFSSGTTQIHLDAVYSKVVLNSWIVLACPTYAELYSVEGVTEESTADYGLVAKTTRLDISGENIQKFSPRTTTVYAESEELTTAETPLTAPVEGSKIVLDETVKGLKSGQRLIVQGQCVRASLKQATTLTPSDRLKSPKSLTTEDELILLGSPQAVVSNPALKKYPVMDGSGLEGTVTLQPSKVVLKPADEDDATVCEQVTLKSATAKDDDHTELELSSALQYVYDRTTVTICGNVALTNHGESTREILGSGDASKPFQRFTLRQTPLTYVSSSTPSGAETTLEVRVNDVLWSEVSTLYGHGPEERIYVTHTDDDGYTTIQFGDGRTGARLPTGRDNVEASYRMGIGLEGLVKADQLTQLMSRPLGLKSATNPAAATGAQDPETLKEARQNAPLTVLTLDRIVSLQDYEDFARAYAGIAKAAATWTWDGERRGVFVTVAGPKGAAVKQGSTLYTNLLTAMRKAGDPLVPLQVASYQEALFRLSARVRIDEDYQSTKVLAAVKQELRQQFSFGARTFGQPVVLSEVVAAIQQVEGVVAVHVDSLYRTGDPASPNDRLLAAMPQPGAETVTAAELLTLDTAPISLEVM